MDVLEQLSKNERILLHHLLERSTDEVDLDTVIRELEGQLDDAGVRRSVVYLENKGLVKTSREPFTVYRLTDRGREVLDRGLPEEVLYDYVRKHEGVSIKEIKPEDLGLDKQGFTAALGILKRSGVLRIDKGRLYVSSELGSNYRSILEGVRDGRVDVLDEGYVQELIKRGLLEKVDRERVIIRLTERAHELSDQLTTLPTDVIETITRDVLQSGEWRHKPFRAYDVRSPVPPMFGGRKHPLRVIWEEVRDIFREMGFKEMRGNWVDLVFWNMDAMFIPQDHPARDVQDTFYLGVDGRLPERELVDRVREVHETGGSTGSLGWRFVWDEKVSRQLMLRSHTTCLTFRMFAKGIKPPVKYFSIGRVFRNEAIDRFHLPEFHQIEGFVADEGLTLRDLFGYIREFYNKIGVDRLRFKPTYNPYTEPSAEIFAYHPQLNKWIEVGNSGMFRPESLAPYDIDVPVIAWGLALERLAMLVYDLDDIRKLIGHTCDINWLRSYTFPRFRL